MHDRLAEEQVRLTAFQWLADQVDLHGDILPRALLAQGFELEGIRIPLVAPQGIFKPRVLKDIPLSITTTVHGPYDDQLGGDNMILYRYRGTDPWHRDNVGLRKAMVERTPLIYLHAVSPGKYMAVWPVFIVADNPESLTFTVAVDDYSYAEKFLKNEGTTYIAEDSGRRQYITATVKHRVHQRSFRERVLNAYRKQCALCQFRHDELLDAAHIIPDGEPGGDPVVVNGIALCKFHHAAFDKFFLGINPDYVIHIRRDILDEDDGPMLLHGLKSMHGKRIILPRSSGSRPSQEKLEQRFDKFLRVENAIAV